ncbi:ribonuclease Z [Ulvibacter litoralis]|uniref:Ribonuclease Z n=1 Tax=Ulvibacter litoralis TaxID=227084 RepID=A0A1G7FTD4_9FLAO|nr:ribonuclease Z [Ulvibacter litoralis]GHC63557.1 ribonuclease Z [Ulvibacter litoralis]SDE79158.1 ribonuclease Z [Ulvibacter litoralis]
MKLTILGCHSATPRWDAHPTAQVLEVKGHLFLIDCGEGTQVQLRRCKVKFARIKHIFISHLHGDHFFGLIGLISTFRLLGRDADLHVYGPKGIKEAIVLQLKLGKSWTNFSLFFHELDSKEPQLLFDDDKVSVTTIPLKHRIYTNGFLFREKPNERKLDINAVREANVSMTYYNKIKQGHDVLNEAGRLIKNEAVTFNPEPSKSYAFCSDTMYAPEIIPQIKNVTLLYHEATFLEEHAHLCELTMHSTAKQAASIASEASVKTLLLGHYSGRYGNYEFFRREAQTVFENVALAEDGKSFDI